MQLLHDYLLVKEVVNEGTIEGTNLRYKYDDDDPFMEVEVVDVSCELAAEYSKYYPTLSSIDIKIMQNSIFYVGSHLLIRRINKVPYKDGLFFVSFKDVIATLTYKEFNNEEGN